MDDHQKQRQEWLGVRGKNDWKTNLGGCILLALLFAATVDWNFVFGRR